MPDVKDMSELLARHGVVIVVLIVVLGAFLWGVYYLLTKAVPQLLAVARTDLETARTESLAAMKEQRQEYHAVLREQQLLFSSTLTRIEDRGNVREERAEQRHALILQSLNAVAERLGKLEEGK